MSDRWDLHSPVFSFLVSLFSVIYFLWMSWASAVHTDEYCGSLGDMAEIILNDSYSLDLKIHSLYILISTHLSVILEEYLILFARSISWLKFKWKLTHHILLWQFMKKCFSVQNNYVIASVGVYSVPFQPDVYSGGWEGVDGCPGRPRVGRTLHPWPFSQNTHMRLFTVPFLVPLLVHRAPNIFLLSHVIWNWTVLLLSSVLCWDQLNRGIGTVVSSHYAANLSDTSLF